VSGHSWRHAQRFMSAAEVVERDVQAHGASETFEATRHATSATLSRNASHSLPRFQAGFTVPRRCRGACRGHGIAHCPSRFGESFQDAEAIEARRCHL
jgi:hypothetical protein